MFIESWRAIRRSKKRTLLLLARSTAGSTACRSRCVSRLGPLYLGTSATRRRCLRGHSCGDHGRWRWLYHGARDDLFAGHANQGGCWHFAVPDYLRDRLHDACLHATTNFTVDIVLAVLLLVGGVIGAQIGTRIGVKMKAEQLRILLGSDGSRGVRQTGLRSSCAALRTLFAWRDGGALMLRWLAILVALALPASAEEVVLGMSQDKVAITANFDGSEILIFGAVKREEAIPEGDPLQVIVAIQGPSEPITVRRKEKRFGIWVNTQSVDVDAAPSFYAVATSAPLDEVLSSTEDLRYKISIPSAIRSVGCTNDCAGFPKLYGCGDPRAQGQQPVSAE